MNNLLAKIKELMYKTQGTYIIVEDDEPQMVVLSFEQYEKLINKRTNVTIAGNIHKDIVKRANETMQRAMEKRPYSSDSTVDEIEAASQMGSQLEQNFTQSQEFPLVQEEIEQSQFPSPSQDQLYVEALQDQEFSPAREEVNKA